MNKLTSRLAKDLKKKGGVIRKISHYGQRPLAYPIHRKGQKHDVGRYTRYFVQTSPQGLKEFLTTLRLDEDIIRYKPFKMTPGEFMELADRPTFKHKPKISEAHYDALRRTTNINYYIARTLLMQGKISIDELQSLGTHSVRFEPYFKSREQDLAERVFAARETLEGITANNSDSDLGSEFGSEFDMSSDYVSGSDAHSSDAHTGSESEPDTRSLKAIKRHARQDRLRKIRNLYQTDQEYAEHELDDVELASKREEFREAFEDMHAVRPARAGMTAAQIKAHYEEVEKFPDATPEEKQQRFEQIFDAVADQLEYGEADDYYSSGPDEPQRDSAFSGSKQGLFRQIDEFTELSEDVEARAAARRFNHLNLSGDEETSQFNKKDGV